MGIYEPGRGFDMELREQVWLEFKNAKWDILQTIVNEANPDRFQKAMEGFLAEFEVYYRLRLMEFNAYFPRELERYDIDLIAIKKNLTFPISIKTSARAYEYQTVVLEMGTPKRKGWFYTSLASIWCFVIPTPDGFNYSVLWGWADEIRRDVEEGREGIIETRLTKNIRKINSGKVGFRTYRNLSDLKIVRYPTKYLRSIWEL